MRRAEVRGQKIEDGGKRAKDKEQMKGGRGYRADGGV
jgi:hypothetical protein